MQNTQIYGFHRIIYFTRKDSHDILLQGLGDLARRDKEGRGGQRTGDEGQGGRGTEDRGRGTKRTEEADRRGTRRTEEANRRGTRRMDWMLKQTWRRTERNKKIEQTL